MRKLLRSESGSAALELAITAPVLMLLVLGLLQFGIWYHAKQIAIGAAQEGSRVAAAEGSSEIAAERRASEILRAGLGRLADRPRTFAEIGPERVSVRVEATLPGLLPFPGLREFRLDASATAYRERFRTEGEGR